MSKTIGIIGCGWLGFPLAKNLLQQGYPVKGTTTSSKKMEVLKKEGISPYQIQIGETDIDGPITEFLTGTDILIINIPPRLRGTGPKENYIDKIRLLLKKVKLHAIPKVVFVSSTSVYGNNQGEVNEDTLPKPVSESGKQLLECEKLIQESKKFESTIIRFAGLIGPDRHPVTMLSGRTDLNGGDAPVNLIHLNDCIGIITAVIKKSGWGQLMNAVYPAHPIKRKYYMQIAKKRNVEPPKYLQIDTENHKKISICNIFLTKNYRFLTSILE